MTNAQTYSWISGILTGLETVVSPTLKPVVQAAQQEASYVAGGGSPSGVLQFAASLAIAEMASLIGGSNAKP